MSNARNLGNITTGGATGATTASVTTSINNLIDAAPGALNTLNELAAALGDDANFSTTVTNSIATKLPLAGGTLTGDVTFTGDSYNIVWDKSANSLKVGEDAELRFGSGDELRIFHDGTNNIIRGTTSPTYIQTDNTIHLTKNNASENMAKFIGDGAVELYHNNAKKVETTSSGVTVTGSVGIGTDSPGTPLHVYTASGNAYHKLEANANGTRSANLYWAKKSDGSTLRGYVGTTGDASKMEIATSTNDDIHFYTNNDPTDKGIMLKANGNVGIGTTTPGSRRLKIVGSSSAYPLSLDSTNTDYQLEFTKNGTSEWWIAASASSFKIHENGVGDKLTVLAGGKVGVGTNNPTKLLHLYGDENVGGLGLVIQDDGWGAPNGMFMTTVRNSDGAYTIRKNTSNNFDFATYTDMLSVRGDGKVGIGTTTPSVELSIAGSDPQLCLWEGADGASSSKVQLGTGTTQGFINLHKGDGTRTVQLNSAGDTYFNGGNVGIGTASPGARLHVLNDSGSPAVNTNDTDELVRLGTADGIHGGIDLHATTKHSTLRSTVFRTTSSDNYGFGYNAYNMGTIDIGRVDQGYTWNGTNGNGEYTGGVQQQPRYMRKAHFSGQILANNTYYTIAENMSESRFTIECFCGDASSRDYKKYVGYYTSTAYGVYGLTQVIHMNGGWNSGSFDMRVSAPNGNLSIDLRFQSYYNSSNIAGWMCIYTGFV